jgi:Cu(I)/Ag(I) efflux system membrane fusion protein
MSAMGWWTRLSRGARRAVLVISVALLAAGTAFVLVGRGRDSSPRGQARPDSAGRPAPGGMAGMDMSAGGEVRLTPEQVRQFGVTFGSAEQRTLSDEVRTVGVVAFDESRQAQVAPKFGGYVERLYVDFTGQPVRRGQPLLEIYSPELVAAQQELLVAARLQATMGQSSVPGVAAGQADLVGAARDRLRLRDVSDAEIREVLRTGRARRTTTLYSPASGVVVEKKVLRGQAVQAGAPLYTIADLSTVWVEAELREADAGMVRPGSAAAVELSAFPGRPLSGVVDYVYPTLQPEARTLKARIRLPNPDGRLKPGMYATVRLSAPGRTALTVPASAVVRTGERNLVFTDAGGGRLQPQEVEVGRVSGEYAEVLSGVEPGQRVVTSAQFLLDSESNLGEVMRGMAGMGGPGAMKDMPGMAPGGMQDRGADMRGMPGMSTPPRPR